MSCKGAKSGLQLSTVAARLPQDESVKINMG